MDAEIIKGFLQLGGVGILGIIFYFSSRSSDKRLDVMLENSKKERDVLHADAGKERELWRSTIDTLSHNVSDNIKEIKNFDCNYFAKRNK